jgi:hypothetical protein
VSQESRNELLIHFSFPTVFSKALLFNPSPPKSAGNFRGNMGSNPYGLGQVMSNAKGKKRNLMVSILLSILICF